LRAKGRNAAIAALILDGVAAQSTGLTLAVTEREKAMKGAVDTQAVEAQNRTAIEAGFTAWANGTGSPFELLADNATWTIMGRSTVAKTYETREAFMTKVIRPFNARMRVGLKPAVRSMYTDGDTVIVLFEARGTAQDGSTYTNTYAWFLKMQDGRILDAIAFFDSIAFDELWRHDAGQRRGKQP
jgi:hypothetical protein